MFANPVSRVVSAGPCPGAGSTVFESSHRDGGNINAAPNALIIAVPTIAATYPPERSLSLYAKSGGYGFESPAHSCAHSDADLATTFVLIDAMIDGIVYDLTSSSYA
eukprot:31206-Pelagococcus_subviridis.AAC.7